MRCQLARLDIDEFYTCAPGENIFCRRLIPVTPVMMIVHPAGVVRILFDNLSGRQIADVALVWIVSVQGFAHPQQVAGYEQIDR